MNKRNVLRSWRDKPKVYGFAGFLTTIAMTAVIAGAQSVPVQPQAAVLLSPTIAEPRQTVTATIVNAPKDATSATVTIGSQSRSYAASGGTVSFAVPNGVTPGVYTVHIMLGNSTFIPEQRLMVVRELGVKPVLAKVEPAILYRPAARESFVLWGENFSMNPPDGNAILIDQHERKVKWDGCDPNQWKDVERELIHGTVINGEQIQLCNVPTPKQGLLPIAIRQGGQTTEVKTVRTYRWSRWEMILLSLSIVAAAGGLVMLLMCAQKAYRINKEEYGFFRALFLDPETDTYSLSKYQLMPVETG